MSVLVSHVRWEDIAPGAIQFNRDRTRDIARRVLAEYPRDREAAISRALIAAFGPGIAGWCWGSGDGGIVPSYCCGNDSLRGTQADMARTVVRASEAWIERIAELAELFAELHARAPDLDPSELAARAASDLLPRVVAWTGVAEAWYGALEIILTWWLEHEGIPRGRAQAVVEDALDGRFESWCEPDPDQIDAAVAAFAERATVPAPTQPPLDALAAWLDLRDTVPWNRDRYFDVEPVTIDAHTRYIRDVDAARSPERADRMRDALTAARADAAGDAPLDFSRLAAWQTVVLGEPAAWRSTDAFAHSGRERYASSDDVQRRFDACLRDANDASVDPVARAARVYLDVCFFHPFPDGNARAARLALDFTLSRASLALHAAEPVFRLARRATDPGGPHALHYLLDYVTGPRAR